MTWTSDEKLMSPPVATFRSAKKSDGARTENGGYLPNDNNFLFEFYVSELFLSSFYVSDRDGIKSVKYDGDWR